MKLNFNRKLGFMDCYPYTILSFHYTPVFSKDVYFLMINNKDDHLEVSVRVKSDTNTDDYEEFKHKYSKNEKRLLEEMFLRIELKHISLFERDIVLDGDRSKLEWKNGTRMKLCFEWSGNDVKEWMGLEEFKTYLMKLGKIEHLIGNG